MISIVIPVFNRREGLRLVFAALEKQTFRGFEVVVADDGSTDDPLDVVMLAHERLTVQYCWHPHNGFQAGKARNAGAKLAHGNTLLFVDADVLLNRFALEHYNNISLANPGVIVAGRYDWLSPMVITVEDVHLRWDAILRRSLPELEIEGPPVGIQGVDPRALQTSRFDSTKVWRNRYCLALFTGNLLVPAEIFRALGGFDEAMVGHGGEDCEFAMRAEESQIPVIFAEEVVGYHVYHWRNQERNEREVQRNIEYIRSKHDLVALGVVPGGPDQLPLVEAKPWKST